MSLGVNQLERQGNMQYWRGDLIAILIKVISELPEMQLVYKYVLKNGKLILTILCGYMIGHQAFLPPFECRVRV
jgi:hypothetical protein